MSTTFAPVTLRLSRSSATPGVNPAVKALKQMPVEEIRAELRGRRNQSSVAREADQRDVNSQRASVAAARLRSLGR